MNAEHCLHLCPWGENLLWLHMQLEHGINLLGDNIDVIFFWLSKNMPYLYILPLIHEIHQKVFGGNNTKIIYKEMQVAQRYHQNSFSFILNFM